MKQKDTVSSAREVAGGSRPLVTFGVTSCNEERFVAEAIKGAFAQTYSPLQIVISDDCSSDRTFEIERELVANYKGPHKVILNRNEKREGWPGNINRLMSLAAADLVVVSHADDFSLPNRAQAIFEAWDSTGRRADLIHSRVIHVDEEGNPRRRTLTGEVPEPTGRIIEQRTSPQTYLETLSPVVLGSALACTKSLFKTFGDVPAPLVHEDNVLAFRSLLSGSVIFLDTFLLKYRLHGKNMFNANHELAKTGREIEEQESWMRKMFASRGALYGALRKDLATARDRGMVSELEYKACNDLAERKMRILSLQTAFMDANAFTKLPLICKLAHGGVEATKLRKLLVRLMPRPVFRSAKLLRGRWGAKYGVV